MADSAAEFQTIVKDRNTAFANLAALEKPALKEFNRLVNKKNSGAALSAVDQARLASAGATLDSVHHGMWIVGQISLQAMNDSALLRDITNSLNGISGDLKKTTKKLDHIVEIADTTAKVTSTFVKLVQKLSAIVASGAI